MLVDNLKKVQDNIINAARRAGRNPEDITLIAVSKTKPVSMIQEIYDAGVREFGENKENSVKIKSRKSYPNRKYFQMTYTGI